MAWIDRLHLPAGALALCVTALSGCSVMGPRGSPLPQDGPDMLSVYRGHMASEGQDSDAIRERIPRRSADDDQLRTQRRTDISPTLTWSCRSSRTLPRASIRCQGM